MPRTAPIVVALAFSLAVCVLGQVSQPAQAPATGTGLLAGRIVDAKTTAPIAYATVDINPHTAQALTDGEGRFVFNDLPKGNYTLRANKPGWIGQAFGSRRPGGPSIPIPLAEADRRADIVIGLYKYAVIAGHVFDDAGDPLVNVDVRIFQRTFVAGRPRVAAVGSGTFQQRARTDDRGAYRFSNLTPGDYVLAVPTTVTSQPVGFTENSRFDGDFLRSMTSVGAAPMSLDAGTMRAGPASVTVSPFDLPVPPPTDATPWRTYPTTFAPSALTVSAASVITASAGSARTDVDITMQLVPTYQVSGRITGPDGPISMCAVHLLPADSAAAPLIDTAAAVSDATGSFTLFGVPPGQYVARVVRLPPATAPQRYAITGGTDAIKTVLLVTGGLLSDARPEVAADPLLSADQRVVVGDAPVTGIDLNLRAGPRITGRLVFDGHAAPPTPAQLAATTILPVRADGTIDNVLAPTRALADGTFATASLWPARYLLRAADELHVSGTNADSVWHLKGATLNGQDITSTAFDLTTDMKDVVITYTDQASTITGTVSSDDPKLAPFDVILFPIDANAWVDYGRGSPRVQQVMAEANGSFSLHAPPAGTYALIAIPDDQAGDWQNPAVLARLLPLADQIEVRDGQPLTHPLHARSLR